MPRPAARIAGLSVHDGIILVAPSAWSAAQAMPDGSVRTFSAPLPPAPPLARLPLVRAWTGLVRQGAATRDALAAMRGRPAPRAWLGVALVLAIPAFLGYAGFVLARQALRLADPPRALPLGLGALFLYMLLVVALASRHPRLRAKFRLHAAEHRAIHALEAGRHGQAESFPKEHPRCGTGWTFTLLAVPYAIGCLLPGLASQPPFVLAWAVLGAPVLVELVAFTPAWRVLALPGIALQWFTTQAPTERETRVAQAAADALLAAGKPSTTDPGLRAP